MTSDEIRESKGGRVKKIKLVRCSFCDVRSDNVGVLIKTPEGHKPKAWICGNCIATCVRLMTGRIAEQGRGKSK